MTASPSITEMLLSILKGGLDDPGIALAPIVPTLGNQADMVAVSLHPEAIPVVFDFVKPFRAGRNLGSGGGDAELEHGIKMGIPEPFVERAVGARVALESTTPRKTFFRTSFSAL
jgi:hypothetical protein